MRVLSPETLLHGRYRVLRLVGSGAMSAVYEARDTRLGHHVAIKHNDPANTLPRRAFEREARLLANLQHPALPSVSDYFEEGSDQFLVMRYIPGDDLGHMLRKKGALPVHVVLRWADQLLDALEYLHAQEPPVIHRDIKPQNLKLNGDAIMLLDFGVAKGAFVATQLSSASIHAFTRQYAPLEQLQGIGTDARSDLYALSATLYHLLVGAPPAEALSRAVAVVGRQPDPLVPPEQSNPAVPAELSAVLLHGLALHADDRLPSATAMRAALRMVASELEPCSTEPAWLAQPGGEPEFATTHPGARTLQPAATVVAAATYRPMLGPPTMQAPAAQGTTKRVVGRMLRLPVMLLAVLLVVGVFFRLNASAGGSAEPFTIMAGTVPISGANSWPIASVQMAPQPTAVPPAGFGQNNQTHQLSMTLNTTRLTISETANMWSGPGLADAKINGKLAAGDTVEIIASAMMRGQVWLQVRLVELGRERQAEALPAGAEGWIRSPNTSDEPQSGP